MNKYKSLWKIILILVFANQVMFAKDISGDIIEGDKVSLIPLQGHALSITRKAGFYGDSLFNFTILNGEDVIYEDKDQKDDVYLVFHDSVEEGDRVEIDVIKGKYQYKITNLNTLPSQVLEALKDTPEVELKEEKKIEQSGQKEVPTPSNFEQLEESHESSNIVSEEELSPPIIASEELPISSVVEDKIIEKRDEVVSQPLSIEKDISVADKKNKIVVDNKPSFFEQISTVLGRLFGFSKAYEDKNLTEVTTNSNIDNEKLASEKSLKIAETIQEKKSIATPIAPKISPQYISNEDKDYEIKLEKEAETMLLERRLSIPLSSATPSYPDTGYKEGYKDIEKDIKKQEEKTPVKSIPIEKELPPIVEKKIEKFIEPKKVENIAPVNLQKEEKPEFTQEKIVITKIIDKDKNNNSIDNNTPERMDDRVLGNGYQERESGKLGMKVYKNSRPVTAWIEVFKSGTRERVKTFYTKKGSIPKSVKLPAGTYMVKATYRSPSAKQQKSLKNVVIEEGQSVNKKIAFYDGTLNVTVTKDGVPSYSKVVAYRSGSKKIASYAFSNKQSGKCSLTLENGRYDLKISNYRDKKFMRGISIRSGKTKSIKVEF